MNTTEAAAFLAATQLLNLKFTRTVGEPDASDALAHIEDGEALVKIFDEALIVWAKEAAYSLPGRFSVDRLRGAMATALHESDFMCELRAVREAMEDSHSYGDPHRSQRTHAGTV
jgi:hypothetical protein